MASVEVPCDVKESGAEPLKSVITTPIDSKKATFFDIKMHPILDGIGYVLHDIIHWQRSRGGQGRIQTVLQDLRKTVRFLAKFSTKSPF